MKVLRIMAGALAVVAMTSCGSDDSDVVVDGRGEAESVVAPLPTVTEISVTKSETAALESVADLSFDMLHKVAAQAGAQSGNVSLSPMSAMIAYSLFAQSVDEPYRANLVRALGFESEQQLRDLSLKFMALLPSDGLGVKMSLVNSVWATDAYKLSEAFTQNMHETMHVETKSVDFSDSAAAADLINAWCENRTNGLIKDFVKELNPSTMAVWLNALYFYGAWNQKFDKTLTTTEQFAGRKAVAQVPMMHSHLTTSYAADCGFRYVALPFQKNNYILDLVIADNSATELTADVYDQLLNSAQSAIVDVDLPRFDVQSELSLSEIYDGLKSAVADATFTTMGFPADVKLAGVEIKQNTSFGADEDGAEASAVTGVFAVTSTGDEQELQQVRVTFDHPFYFAIRHTATGAAVMLGCVNNL